MRIAYTKIKCVGFNNLNCVVRKKIKVQGGIRTCDLSHLRLEPVRTGWNQQE